MIVNITTDSFKEEDIHEEPSYTIPTVQPQPRVRVFYVFVYITCKYIDLLLVD